MALYYGALIFTLLTAALKHWFIVGMALYIGFATLLGFLRSSVRDQYSIQHGDLITDLVCAAFVPMFTIAQMETHDGSAAKATKVVEVSAPAPVAVGAPNQQYEQEVI